MWLLHANYGTATTWEISLGQVTDRAEVARVLVPRSRKYMRADAYHDRTTLINTRDTDPTRAYQAHLLPWAPDNPLKDH